MTKRDESSDVPAALRAAGFTVRRCGLNADWCCEAWHLGPSLSPNLNDGDVYLLHDYDSSEGTMGFIVARQFPTRDDGRIVELTESVPLADAIYAACRAVVAGRK